MRLTPGQQALACYRLGHGLHIRSIVVLLCLEPVYQVWSWHVRRSWGIAIDRAATIGPDCYIGHFGGIFIHGGAILGARCHISQDVTIGDYNGVPCIGDDVYLGPGCKLYGPIWIGSNVKIGPNAVVHTNLDANTVIVAPEFVVLSHQGNVMEDGALRLGKGVRTR